MSSTAAPILDLKGIGIRFGGLTALHDISFSVKSHEIVAVIGPNGAGKTTLFNIVTGIYDPTGGTVLCHGKSPYRELTATTVTGLIAAATGAALALFFSYNVESLWEALFTAHYVYQQPFPWSSLPESFSTLWSSLSWGSSVGTLLTGAGVGFAAALTLWNRSRCSPEVIMQRGLARTFQNIRIFPRMSVLENVLVGMHRSLRSGMFGNLFRLPRSRKEQQAAEVRALEILELVDLKDSAPIAAGRLSYGHQRRLEIARALASSPALLLLDEPAAGMNPSEARELMEIIRRIREKGISVLLIEHHMHVVMNISDRIVVLDYGEKIAQGTPEEIRANQAVIEAYLGGDSL